MEKIEIFVFYCRVWISVGSSHIFLKSLKLPINPNCRPPDRIILGRLKKQKEKYGKFKIFVFCGHV